MVSKIQIFSALTQNEGEAGNLHRENSSLSNVNVAALQETSNRVDDVTDRGN
jgi:hypothetical protein